MGKLKSFFHDYIAEQSEIDFSVHPFTPDTCFVLIEHDVTTGETKPLHVYTFRADAEDALRLFAHGQKNYHIPEYLDYRITEVVQS